MLAADICQQRQPASYLAESEDEVGDILNPQLGDLAIVTTESGTALYRLRDPSEVPDDAYVVPSNRCSSVWVLSGPDDSGGGGGAVTAARINALIAAGQPVILPQGTFSMDDLILLDNAEVYIEGAGDDRTILDFTTAPDGIAMYGTGSLLPLPSVLAIAQGDTTIVFSAPHNLAVRDVWITENTTDGSFNPARPIYHDGEYFEVATVVNPTTVTVTRPAYSSYSGVSISNFKLEPIRVTIKNVGMRFKQGLGAGFAGIQVSLGINNTFDSLDLSGSQYTQIYADRHYRLLTKECYFFDNQSTIGNNYGILIGNSQKVDIVRCEGSTLRHVVSFGGGIADGAVVNRDITLLGGHYSTLGTSWAVDFHGNCFDYELVGVNAPGGLGIGGDACTVTGGRFGNGSINTTAIVAGEMCGLNILIDGATVYATRSFSNGLINIFARDSLIRPSVMDLKNIKIELGDFASPTYPAATCSVIQFGALGVPVEDDLVANFINITCSTNETTAGPMYLVQYFSDLTLGVPAAFRILNFKGCISEKAGLLLDGDAQEVFIDGNTFSNALAYGIRVNDMGGTVKYSPQRWSFKDTVTSTAQRDGILFSGDATYSMVTFEDCASINCGQETPATFRSINVAGALSADLKNNTVGDDQSVATQVNLVAINAVTIRYIQQNNVGQVVNPSLIPTYAGYTTLITDPPFDGPIWDYSVSGYEWGANGASATIPYLFRRDANNFIQWQFQNKIAAGNTLAAMALTVVGGDVGNSASGSFFAAALDYASTHLQGKMGVQANSDAVAIALTATTGGQEIHFYAGTSSHRAFRLDEPANAGETSAYLYSFDASAESMIKTGAAGTGPGGVGRALYID